MVEFRKKKRDEEENLTLMQDQEPAQMSAEMMSNLLMLNEENIMANLLTKGEDLVETNTWYLDNRASNHMTGDRTKYKELDEKLIGNVKFSNGSIVPIHGKGSILFQCKNDNQRLLTKVYYIPNLKCNIISLSQITEEGSKGNLAGSFLNMFDINGSLLMKVKRSHNRLYKILLETNQPTSLLTALANQAWLWHVRLGHMNFQTLKMMADKKMATGLSKIIHPNQL